MTGRSVCVAIGDDSRGEQAKTKSRYRWTAAMTTKFLDHLAATCNIRASAQAIGVSAFAAHRLRRRDAEFAAACGVALETGYQMLETHLVGTALAMSGAVEPDAAEGSPRNEATVATRLAGFEAGYRMLRHRAERRRGAERGQARPWTIITREEVDVEILKKLAALAARRLPA